jgi:hypothetical protein
MLREKADRMRRVDRGEDARMACNLNQTGDGDHHEPEHHQGAEENRDLTGAA